MALVTLETHNGASIDVNPGDVKGVTTYDHYDHDMQFPDDWYVDGPNGLEISDERQEEAEAQRVSTRTLVLTTFGTLPVKGEPSAVKKALGL